MAITRLLIGAKFQMKLFEKGVPCKYLNDKSSVGSFGWWQREERSELDD